MLVRSSVVTMAGAVAGVAIFCLAPVDDPIKFVTITAGIGADFGESLGFRAAFTPSPQHKKMQHYRACQIVWQQIEHKTCHPKPNAPPLELKIIGYLIQDLR